MTDFTQILTKLQGAADLADKTLSSSEVSVLDGTAGQTFSGKLGTSGSFTAAVGASASLQLFNSTGDEDGSGIFGVLANQPVDSVQWVPLLDAGSVQQQCWLKYALAGSVKAGAKLSGGPLSFGLDSAADLQLSTYMPHSPAQKLGAAVQADLPALPHILSLDDVRTLAAGQAVSIELQGQFGFNLTLKWSDLLANTINPLADLAQGGKALAISITGGIDAAFALSLDSRFRVVFAGIDDEWLQLQVWRNDKRTSQASISAGVLVKFVDPDAAAQVLGSVAGGLLGEIGLDPAQVKKTVQELRTELSGLHTQLLGLGDGLNKKLTDWLDRLIDPAEGVLDRLDRIQEMVTTAGFDATHVSQQLGSTVEQATALIAEVKSWPAKLEAKIDAELDKLWASLGLVKLDEKLAWLLGWLNKLEAGIVSIAKSKIELGFKYEWLRTRQRGALVQMKIDRSINNLKVFHTAALDLDGGQLLTLADKAGAKVVDARLLGHRIKETRIAYGFTLGIGKWSFWSKWKYGDQLVSNERRLQGQSSLVQNALTGYAEYADVFYGPDYTLRGDLSVAQHDFQQPDALGQWETGLNLQSQGVYPKLDHDELDLVLDQAVLWGCIEPAELLELRDSLVKLTGKKLRANLQLKLSNSAFANVRFNNLLSVPPSATYERAVSGAIPWMSYAERSTVQARETFYAEVARQLVSTANVQGDYTRAVDFALRAARALREAGAGSAIWRFEQRQSQANSNSFSAGSIARLAQLNGTMRLSRDRITAGFEKLSRLADSTTVSKGVELAKEAYDHLKKEWNSGIRQRAFGRLLVLLHRKAEAPARSLAVSLTLDVLGAGDKVTETILIQPAR